MDDKEKIDKALAKITKLIDKYELEAIAESDQYEIENFNKIKNKLSDSTASNEVKIKKALHEIYDQLMEYLDIGCSTGSDEVRDLKKVKSILGQLPEREWKLQGFQRQLRNWY